LNGKKFNWNQTPLAPVGQRALAFLDPANRLSWAPHAIDAFTIGYAPDHYRLLRFWNKLTGGCMTTGTYALYPAYCKVPAISEGDRTIEAAAELLEIFKEIVPNKTKQKVQHCEAIQKLTSVLSDYNVPQRVNTQQQRPQRVAVQPTDSSMPASRETIQNAPRIHQRRTRRNTPFEAVQEIIQQTPDVAAHREHAPKETPTHVEFQSTSNKENVLTPTTIEESSTPSIPKITSTKRKGKNRGSLKKSRRVLAALVDAQLKIDKQRGLHLIKVPVNANEQITYHAPHPKGNPAPLPSITQDYDDDDTL
jgi:hypothetical protein